ncbi:hypothetical protein M426DRAFT_19215 [Hypoxylon sp. CI-4A]|nr:hypothetical protein M426DRAFT_19215 [Hypoxylon sp. CI-4A]
MADANQPTVRGKAKKVLDEVLGNAMEKKEIYGLALTTPLAAGKTTQLIFHISKLMENGKAPPGICYILSAPVEVAAVKHYLGPKQLDRVQVYSSSEFLSLVRENGLPDESLTYILDINWYSTVEDEVLFGQLVQGVGEKKGKDLGVAVILFMSDFESGRAVNALEKGIGNVSRCNYSADHLPTPEKLRIAFVDNYDRWTDRIKLEEQDANDKNYRIVVGSLDWVDLPGISIDAVFHEVPNEEVPVEERVQADLTALIEKATVAIDPKTPYSLKISRLATFISPGETSVVPRLDTNILQVVIKRRKLLQCEIRRQQSWLVKSVNVTTSPTLRFLANMSEEEFHDRDQSAEDLGPAWNDEFMFMALALFHHWPNEDLNRMPVRKPVRHLALVDTVKRLYVLRCITEGTRLGTFRCTDLGSALMEWYYGVKDPLRRDFHAGYLLCQTKIDSRDANTSKLIARIAAIAACGSVGSLLLRGEPAEDEELAECCVFFPSKTYAGAIWVALGLYMLYESDPSLSTRDQDGNVVYQGFIMHRVMLGRIQGMVPQFEEYLQADSLPRSQGNMLYQALTNSQIAFIDRQMMWAWLHRIVMLRLNPQSPPREYPVVEMGTMEDIAVNLESEVIRVEPIQQYCENLTGGRSIFAFYSTLQDVPGSVLQAASLTWIHPRCFGEVQERTGIRWPDAVAAFADQ